MKKNSTCEDVCVSKYIVDTLTREALVYAAILCRSSLPMLMERYLFYFELICTCFKLIQGVTGRILSAYMC